MTRFVVDASAVVHLASEEIDVSAEHELLAPTLLRSQTLSLLHEQSPAPGAWRSDSSATPCSGVALTQLQAAAFVTLDAELARSIGRDRRHRVD